VVVPGALYCKECGATLQSGQLVQARDYNPVVAALLSIIPGLGHVYRGRVGRGVLWFFVVAIAYGMGPIGYLLHLACAANAALSGAIGDGTLGARRRLRRMRRYDAP
jgi:TM2 domain-containing membrane protein YozV